MLRHLDDNGSYSCSTTNTGGRLLPTGKGAKTETKHNDFVVRREQSARSFFFLTDDVSKYRYANKSSKTYIG